MRHTFASILDSRGVPQQTIADLMGHKDMTTFQRTYRHQLSPVEVSTKALMNDVFGKRKAAA